MNEVLKVDTDRQTVSARDLYKALEIRYDFKRWIDANLKNFSENTDYFRGHMNVTSNRYGGEQSIIDYDLTIETAKHIALMSNTEKGKSCRQYLIEVEKAWNSPEQVMARALKLADDTIHDLHHSISLLRQKVEDDKPKVLFAEAVTASDSSILVRELAKILRQNGEPIGEKRLYIWLRDNGYIIKGTTQPTQRAMELGLFETIERTVQRSGKPPIARLTTKVTGKGQEYFINKFLNR